MPTADAPERTPEPASSPSDVEDWLTLIDYLTSEFADNDQVLECELEDVSVAVPMQMSPDAETANWRFDGGLTMSVGEVSVPLRDWRRYWERSD